MVFLILFLSLSARCIAEQTGPEEGAYIAGSFKSANQPLPQLGWILPSGELVTEQSAPSLLVLSDRPVIVNAEKSASIPARQIKNFVKQQKIDCDQLDEPSPTDLYLYKTGLPPQKKVTQVFVLNARPGSIESSGLIPYKPTPQEEAAIWNALDATPSGKRLEHAFAIPESQVFYIVAATYNRKGVLIRSGIFLENHLAQILGKEIGDTQGAQQCDGCGVITAKDGIDAVYPVLNLFKVPGLAYPALLADTSTVELRAIELFTFSPKGAPSRFRLYEYVVTCILGTPEEQAKP